jgi:hypothetical protein
MDYGHLGTFSLEYATGGVALLADEIGYTIKPAPYSNGHAAEFIASRSGKDYYVEMKSAGAGLKNKQDFLNQLNHERTNLNQKNVILVVDFSNKPSLLQKACRDINADEDHIYPIHAGNLNYSVNRETYELVRESIGKQLRINEEIYHRLTDKEKIELNQPKIFPERFEYFKNKFKVGI